MNENPELNNESYVLYDHVLTPLAAQLERKPRRDRGMRRGRHSTSSSSTFDQPSSLFLFEMKTMGRTKGHQLLRGYNRKNGPKRCAIQIDIQKAYDTCITSSKFSICLNGGIHGYFKGGRGLRHGDPISPYLFTLVMEVFNLIMIKNITDNKEFGYYFGCKELRHSHICFAKDLLVLCKGNKESLQVIKQSLEEFAKVSSLAANLGRVYLGVPLLAKRLSVQDCKVLLDKVYWASVYLLPNTIIKYINKMFTRFLWNSGESARGKARIAWKMVCRPKEQGGLGIKPLKRWNEVLLIRQFWKISENKKSLWAEWVNVVKLKHKSVWNVQVDTNDSWAWKCIRDMIKDHIMYEIGKGDSVSVWYDKWSSNGRLRKFITQRNIYDARLSMDAKIPEMIKDN
ncbi:RNA-directed DNA polymerase, eukaryota, reverse transcriptase zinc-binding domain protein [Tanacetum coccineum]